MDQAIIRNYILNDELTTRDKLERFDIAWDISHSFTDIQLELKKNLINKLINKLHTVFQSSDNYKIIDDGLREGSKYGTLKIFRKDWEQSSDKPLLNYFIAAEQRDIHVIYYGIEKMSESIPYSGAIDNIQSNDSEFFKSIFYTKQLQNCGFKSEKELLMWRYMDEPLCGMWEKEFYMKIIEPSGLNNVIDEFISRMSFLKEATENAISNAIERYNQS